MFLRLSPKLLVSIVILSLLGCASRPSGAIGRLDSLAKFTWRYKELTKEHQKLLEAFPQNESLRLKIAEFYYNFKDYQKVKEMLKDIDSSQAKIILAKAFSQLKEYDYAIEIFEQLKPLPDDSEYLYLYGYVLEKKNLFPRALKLYEKVKVPFDSLAKSRSQSIKAKIEEGVPSEVLEIFRQAEDFIKENEDEAAIILLVDENIEVHSNNTYISTVHVLEKVLKERGKELAEVEIGYDSTYQRVDLEFARTITEDSKVIYAGKESIRDVSRYLNYPLYSNSRAFIISMPSVDVGAFIEYRIKISSSKLINQDDFSFIYRLREGYPIFKAKFNLIVPEQREIFFKFFNQEYSLGIDLKPQIFKKEAKKIYTWDFKQIKPIIPEHAMPVYSLINPAVLISSFSSWDEIYKWWHSLYQDKIELPDSTKEFVQDFTKGIVNDQAKAKKIYEYVAQNIRYVAIEYGEGGHEPHYAQDVFINRYGDCKDQAMLLVAMLRAAGLKAYPVLISTRSAYPINENFPSINFDHAICALKVNDDLIFMDPTSETTPFWDIPLSDQTRTVMVFFDNEWLITDTPQSKDNEVKYNMEVLIDSQENAQVKRTVTSRGFFASGYRWYLKYTHPAIIKEDIQKKMTAISSLSRLLDYEIKNIDNFDENPQLRYRFTAEKFLNPAGNLKIVPYLEGVSLDHNMISKEKRDFPIDFEGIYTKTVQIKIDLPKNLKVKYLPSSRRLKNPWFHLEVFYESSPKHINFYQKFTNKKRFVKKEEYQEFKKQVEDALYLLREEIILEQ